jgi:hypothetical protein
MESKTFTTKTPRHQGKPPNFNRFLGVLVSWWWICLLLLFTALPASAEIILQDDFNSGLRLWRTGSHVSIDPTAGQGRSGAARIDYHGPGTSAHLLTRGIPGKHQELYIRFDFKVEGFPHGGAKFLKLRALQDDDNYANVTWAIDQDSGSFREVSFGAGHLVNDTQETIRYDGEVRGQTGPVRVLRAAGRYTIPLGVWQSFEVHLRLNSDGQRDGLYRVWIDDRLLLHAENIINRHDRNPRHFNQLLLGNYCQPSWAAPWVLYYDNLLVATAPIGQGARATMAEAP